MNGGDWRDALGALLGDSDREGLARQAVSTPGKEAAVPVQKGCLDVVVERKGRGGKTATIVCGFTIGDEDVAAVASKLKQRLGAGGSARGGEILIQGDRAADVLKALAALGFKARRI